VGWGAALAYQETGSASALALAVRVGEALLAQQLPGGAWDNTGGFAGEGLRIEVTCEFVVLLDEMIAGLAAKSGTPTAAASAVAEGPGHHPVYGK
jgi:hypothetical protein